MKSKQVLKTFLINLCILSGLLLIVELFFGGWFNADNNLQNLGIRREIKTEFKHHFYGTDSVVTKYTRDQFGFRGKNILNHPEKIDILTIGGSTTDQLYITDSLTWQEQLETKLKASGKNLLIANAGMDGQSTYGHIKNFQLWFPQVEGLKPKYILFYIGINDFFSPKESGFDVMGTAHLSSFQKVKIKIKDNSVLYNLYRKVKGVLRAEKRGLGHDKIEFEQYSFSKQAIATDSLVKVYQTKNLQPFKRRLEILLSLVKQMGAKPIFITQPTALYRLNDGEVSGVQNSGVFKEALITGVDYYNLLTLLNEAIGEVCKEQCPIVELTSLPIWEEDDFYDWFHMTPKGTEKVANQIFRQLAQRLE